MCHKMIVLSKWHWVGTQVNGVRIAVITATHDMVVTCPFHKFEIIPYNIGWYGVCIVWQIKRSSNYLVHTEGCSCESILYVLPQGHLNPVLLEFLVVTFM